MGNFVGNVIMWYLLIATAVVLGRAAYLNYNDKPMDDAAVFGALWPVQLWKFVRGLWG